MTDAGGVNAEMPGPEASHSETYNFTRSLTSVVQAVSNGISMSTHSSEQIKAALKLIFDGIEQLQNSCGNTRQFTIDGRLVGDIGEIIAAREFAIELDKKSRPSHDAKTSDGRDVQIKATFKESLTFTKEPVLYLGLKLSRDGSHAIVFNGPGRLLTEAYGHRKGIGKKQLSFPVRRLKELSLEVPECDRVPLRCR